MCIVPQSTRISAIYGRVSERLKEAVLKTVDGRSSVGSNPTSSTIKTLVSSQVPTGIKRSTVEFDRNSRHAGNSGIEVTPTHLKSYVNININSW